MTPTISRHADGGYTIANLTPTFNNADQAMAAYAELIQRIGRIERDAPKTKGRAL